MSLVSSLYRASFLVVFYLIQEGHQILDSHWLKFLRLLITLLIYDGYKVTLLNTDLLLCLSGLLL